MTAISGVALAATSLFPSVASASSDGTTLSVRAGQPGPSGCLGKAMYPHNSHHVNGTINAEARTWCKNKVPRIHAFGQLWQKRWWGYQKVGKVGNVTKTNQKKVSAFANWGCKNNTFRLTSSHSVTDVDGKVYSVTRNSGGIKIKC